MENSFVYYGSWEAVIEKAELTDEEELEFRRAIAAYGLRGEKTATDRYIRGFMGFVIDDINTARANRDLFIEKQKQNGLKGGRPKKNPSLSQENPKNPKNPSLSQETQKSLNVNVNDNVNKDIFPPTPSYKSYGKYFRVKLTEDDYNRLIQKWGEPIALELIDILDEWCEVKGNTLNNCYPKLVKGWVVERYKEIHAKTSAKEEREADEEKRNARYEEMDRKAARGINLQEMEENGFVNVSDYLKWKEEKGK